MDINRNNYEQFFLDFAEGKLTAKEEEVLQRFLQFNPDLKAELEEFSMITIPPGTVSFPGKGRLLRSESEGAGQQSLLSANDRSIAYMEGDLDPEEKARFESDLATDRSLAEELALLEKTRLKPKYMSFPGKHGLKRSLPGMPEKKSIVNWRILVPVAAAASIALLVFFRIDSTLPGGEIAMTESPSRESIAPAEDVFPAEVQDKKPESANAATSDRETNVPETTVAKPARASAIKVIRDTNAPVPVSTLKQDPGVGTEKDGTTGEKTDREKQRIAYVPLERVNAPSVAIPEQQIAMQQTPLPQINMGSLSVTQLARLQLSRINDMAEQEDPVLLSIASAGIREINRRTGANLSLLASTSEEGDINGIEFRSRFLTVRTPVQREEN